MTKVNKELVELKYRVLQQRITDTQDTLKLMNRLIPCDKDIKSMEIISLQYEKMYQAIIHSGEYDKYEEVENTIISQISKIEAKLDRMIYQLSSQYPKYLEAIEQSENYKNFHGLDIELEKLYALKELLIKCRIFHSQEQQNNLKEKVLDLRFRVLVRRQVEQMVYESHSTKSWLSSRRAEEVFYFTPRIREMVKRIKDVKSDILYSYGSRAIMDDSILINHLIFKLLEQEIEENPQKYIGLLQAPIFNPHLCNIASDSFGKKNIVTSIGGIDIPYASTTSKVNLSLLIGVLKGIISEENTTIIECDNIYKRFGFECRPIVVTEGQEIIRQLFEKVKHTIKLEKRNISETNGRQACIQFRAYDYKFDPYNKMPYYTNAEIRDKIEEQRRDTGYLAYEIQRIHFNEYYKKILKLDLNLENMIKIASLRNRLYEELYKIKDKWTQEPLEQLEGTKELKPAEPSFYEMMTSQKPYDELLWNRFKLDFEKLKVCVQQIDKTIEDSDTGEITFRVCINLDDISELPIDYEKIVILTQDKERGNTFEEVQSIEDEQEH